MRKIALVFAATISVVVLLFNYRTSTETTPSPAAGNPSQVSRKVSGSASSSPGTFSGNVADTRYGPVQVQITMSGGRITSAKALQVPQESGRDVRINAAAVPKLNREAVQAQNARIDAVSGATYTSEGYAQSLQSAIDAAHR